MKVVLDTNVWLSAIFWEGEASKIVELAENKKLEIIITKEIIAEITDILNKEAKFQKFISDKKEKIEDLIRTILSLSKLIEKQTEFNVIKHSSDNIFLETAFDGKADYIVSYNKHLLDLIEFKGIRILNVGDFLKVIKNKL